MPRALFIADCRLMMLPLFAAAADAADDATPFAYCYAAMMPFSSHAASD